MIGAFWAWLLNPIWFGAVIFPSSLVVGATAVRWSMNLPFTSWADALLAFVTFDATVIIDSDSFRKFFASPVVANNIVGIHLCLLLVAGVAWIVLVQRAEKHLAANSAASDHMAKTEFLAMAAGVMVIALLMLLHVATYLAKG